MNYFTTFTDPSIFENLKNFFPEDFRNVSDSSDDDYDDDRSPGTAPSAGGSGAGTGGGNGLGDDMYTMNR